MLVISSVYGPVSYPIIASTMKRHDIKIVFEKSEDADVYMDAIPLLNNTDYVLVSKMLLITPKIGDKIAVWKKGSANDILLQLLVKLYKISPEIIYTEDPSEVYKLYIQGKVDSAMVTVGITKDGEYIEDLFLKKGFILPGICGAKVNRREEDFVSAYQEGIDLFKENPEETAEYVADNLPIPRPSTFIEKIMTNAKYKVERVSFDFKKFTSEIENKK
ncbi:DUF3834 domain-containing protein [Sulfurisphaera javensis]|uniref:DUF3834 domain-containing protein n=1 Tax=Sulfurisphaera javensis TaxID=2049879 RepID=A0AAT9GQ32_9CREN